MFSADKMLNIDLISRRPGKKPLVSLVSAVFISILDLVSKLSPRLPISAFPRPPMSIHEDNKPLKRPSSLQSLTEFSDIDKRMTNEFN